MMSLKMGLFYRYHKCPRNCHVTDTLLQRFAQLLQQKTENDAQNPVENVNLTETG